MRDADRNTARTSVRASHIPQLRHHPSLCRSARILGALATALALPVLLSAPLSAQISVGGASRAGASGGEPRAVAREIPLGPMIRRAYAAGTRDSAGVPGPHYWQQSVDYVIDAHLDVATAVLHGSEQVTLHNTSPDTLQQIVLRLYQNYFRPEESRNDYVTATTAGMVVERLSVDGQAIALKDPRMYSVRGTVARIRPAAPIPPGADATLDVAWHFEVPNVPMGERGERMGRWDHALYQVAQWYPQVAMYDDLRGWDMDQYLGVGEFYNQFGRFDVKVTVPAGWIVGATGTLQDPARVLSARTRRRLAAALGSDTTIHVVTADGRGAGRATAAGDSLTWHFLAPKVNDVAFVASKDFVWDATRALTPDTTLVQVLYWPQHTQYRAAAQVARYALEHHARFVMPYSFPQATVADGPENGMEYPMIVFSSPDFGTTIHELGHEWFPMTVGSNETWYGWMDEGFNDYIDAAAARDYYHRAPDVMANGAGYRRIAGSELEPPMMWPSDFAGPGYGIQAYSKAPLALYALGGVVGDSAVHAAFAAYARAWAYRHPSPWDFFMFMQHRLGRDLGWFFNAWWFTSETFDQGVAAVRTSADSAHITVVDHGSMAMPVILKLDFADGRTRTVRRPASVWFEGARQLTVAVPLDGARLTRVTVDPENRFQDLHRADNVWMH